MPASGTTVFQPPIADLIIEAYSRIQVRGPQLTTEHIIEARRTANMILMDWSGNRSVNLWAVDLISLPLIPGQATYVLPQNTVQLLDVYLRQYQINTTTPVTIGAALTPVLIGGVPVTSGPFGDPMVLLPGSGALSSIIGSSIVQIIWPNHGQSVGASIGLISSASIGGITLSNLVIVNAIIDPNNLTIDAGTPALFTSTAQGATPLYATTTGSGTVTVFLPGHGLSAGSVFNIGVTTTVGGLALNAGAYTVIAAPNSFSFTIASASGAASSTFAAFENGGSLQVTSQVSASDPIDSILYGLSRSEYAAIPDKFIQGRPTSFWFDRQIVPSITLWEVPPQQTGNLSFGLSMYRMRQIEDANPVNGQTPDMPMRFYPAFAAELTAGLAEKFAPEQFMAKLGLASKAWLRAATEDSENVPWFITPALSGYFT